MKGIYLIENRLNGHKYVGRSVDIPKRWEQHIFSAKKGDGYYLHKAINAHGIENFVFSVLEETDNLFERECYWFYLLKPEYNMIAPDEAPSKVQAIKVKSLNKETGEVKNYESAREAARLLGVSKTAILTVLKGGRNTSCGCYWAYNGQEFVIPIDRGNNGKRRKSVTIKKDELSLTFDSISDCARYLNVTPGFITMLTSGKGRAKRAKGFTVELNL